MTAPFWTARLEPRRELESSGENKEDDYKKIEIMY